MSIIGVDPREGFSVWSAAASGQFRQGGRICRLVLRQGFCSHKFDRWSRYARTAAGWPFRVNPHCSTAFASRHMLRALLLPAGSGSVRAVRGRLHYA
jgi:hypothetical protein